MTEREPLADPPLPDHLLPDNLEDALAEIQRLRRYRSLGQIPRLDLLLAERDQARAEVERERQQRDYISLVAQRDIARLQTEVDDLKAALAAASPGVYFSRYGERPDLPEGDQP